MSDEMVDTSAWPECVMVRSDHLRVRKVEHEVVEWEASFCSEDAIPVSPPEEPAEPITEERQRILDALDVQEMWDEFNDATIANVYATCPYRLKDGSLGAYGPNTCHGGCREEPECVTGGPFEERDEMEAVRDYLVGIVSSAVPPSQEPPT